MSDITGHTNTGRRPNPGHSGGSLPAGTNTSLTRTGRDANPGGQRRTSPPPSSAGTGHTTTGAPSGRPSPTHVQSGPKITRLNKS